MPSIIELKNIQKRFSSEKTSVNVLQDINLTVNKGDLVAIVGASGSGKSTLLSILGLLDSFEGGDYYLNNIDIKGISETKAAELRNKYIGFVFQSFNLLNHKTAQQNIELPLYYAGVNKKERSEISKNLLEKVGLINRAHFLPSELSGGQKQRIAIARALACSPEIILADEPTGALDSEISNDIMSLLLDLNSEYKTIIIVTHNTDIANMCKTQIKISDGKILYST